MAKISQGPYPPSVPVDHPDVSQMDGLNTESLKPERDRKRSRKTKHMAAASGPSPTMHKGK